MIGLNFDLFETNIINQALLIIIIYQAGNQPFKNTLQKREESIKGDILRVDDELTYALNRINSMGSDLTLFKINKKDSIKYDAIRDRVKNVSSYCDTKEKLGEIYNFARSFALNKQILLLNLLCQVVIKKICDFSTFSYNSSEDVNKVYLKTCGFNKRISLNSMFCEKNKLKSGTIYMKRAFFKLIYYNYGMKTLHLFVPLGFNKIFNLNQLESNYSETSQEIMPLIFLKILEKLTFGKKG